MEIYNHRKLTVCFSIVFNFEKACHADWNKTSTSCVLFSTWNWGTNWSMCCWSSKATWWSILVWETRDIVMVDTIHCISGGHMWFSDSDLRCFHLIQSLSFVLYMQNAFEMATFIWSLVRIDRLSLSVCICICVFHERLYKLTECNPLWDFFCLVDTSISKEILPRRRYRNTKRRRHVHSSHDFILAVFLWCGSSPKN